MYLASESLSWLIFYDVITVWLNIFSYHVIYNKVMCCFAAAPCGVLIISYVSCGFLPGNIVTWTVIMAVLEIAAGH